MIKVLSKSHSVKMTQNHKEALEVMTYVDDSDAIPRTLNRLRNKELYYADGRAYEKLLGMPVYLRKVKPFNRVFVQAPNGTWVDVTEATYQELHNVAVGELGVPVIGESWWGRVVRALHF
ncbi:hypothetical protein LUCX_185 [Xanthomonas phage vB_XciM_LucasX]|nr:hypothetical protein LUCX_185 [Xanthomonas phage vB_XciM_LucasX]